MVVDFVSSKNRYLSANSFFIINVTIERYTTA